MFDPPHPGEILKEMYIAPLQKTQGLTITTAAKKLGVKRQTLSELVNQKTGVSVEMAIRLSIAFNTTAEYWLNLQMAYDLWQAQQSKSFKSVKKI